MDLARSQVEKLMIQIKNINLNPQVQMLAARVSYVTIPFEGNTNPGDPQ